MNETLFHGLQTITFICIAGALLKIQVLLNKVVKRLNKQKVQDKK